MKRTFLTMTLIVALLVGFSLQALAGERAKDIPVFIDGLTVDFDVKPVIRDGRTLVPFRSVAEALNVAVAWDGSTQTVNATDGNTSVRLQIGNRTAYRNDKPVFLDVPPIIIDGRTLIPLRFFGEAFNCKVDWDSSNKTVKIMSPPKDMTVVGFYALGDRETSSWTDLFGRDYPDKGNGNTDVVGEVALGWYSLDKEGNLLTRSKQNWVRPDSWEDVLKASKVYSLKTGMVVQLTDGDDAISSLLSDEVAMAKAVKGIVQEAKQYQRVNLDFEGLGWKVEGEQLKVVRDRFTRFVSLLSEQLKAANLKLTLTLHPPNSEYRGYDYKALGEMVDKIIIMAYEYGSTPEPVNLVIQAVEMANAVVPPKKLILGISAPTETPESIITKVGIAKRYGLDGIALWRLGLIPDEMWNALRTTVRPKGVKLNYEIQSKFWYGSRFAC